MKITVDTNVLVRSCVCDDPAIGLAGKLLCHSTRRSWRYLAHKGKRRAYFEKGYANTIMVNTEHDDAQKCVVLALLCAGLGP